MIVISKGSRKMIMIMSIKYNLHVNSLPINCFVHLESHEHNSISHTPDDEQTSVH